MSRRGPRRAITDTQWSKVRSNWRQQLSCGHFVYVSNGIDAIGLETVKYRHCRRCGERAEDGQAGLREKSPELGQEPSLPLARL